MAVDAKSLLPPLFPNSTVSSVHPEFAHSTTPKHLGAVVAGNQSLDIYAHKYVPFWLRAVNESFAMPKYASPLHRISYQDYISSFAGSLFLEIVPDVQLPPLSIDTVSTSNLTISNYTSFWQERLQHEYASQASQYRLFGLFNVTLENFDDSRQLFRLKVPGIREDAPRVDLGDVLLVRPLLPVLPATIGNEVRKWYQSGEGIAPGFLGIEHHAVVWSIIRRDEFVILRMPDEYNRSGSVNVTIPVQGHKCSPTWRGVLETGKALSRDHLTRNEWLRSMLFPTEADCVLQTTLSRGTFDLKWYEPELNYEQKRAAYSVVTRIYGTVPYLISGPPGTGKTKTLVETTLQILNSVPRKNSHLLICAPSDAAADTLVVRLAIHLGPKHLFRLNGWTRSFSEVPGTVLPFCYADNENLFSIPDFETMMAYKVVVTTCRDAEMLVQARLTNEALSIFISQLLRTVGSVQDVKSSIPLHWSALLLDEAAQATEPESLIPLSVVMPPTNGNTDAIPPQVVLAGDEHQLGPKLATKHHNGHEKSLFQRLSELELYANHPLSRQNGLKSLKFAMLPILRPPFTNLIRNYRSHPSILSMPSALFYHDTLIPEKTEASEDIMRWAQWPSPHGWPILFHQNNSLDDVESVLEGDGTGAGSLVNREEATTALSVVDSFLKLSNSAWSDNPLKQDDVIVMSPFRAQVNYLRKIFRQRGFYNVSIGPLEAFQGLESRLVLLCTTRTRLGQPPNQKTSKYVQEDIMRSLGVIDDRKRFNVAITRAKEGLIVIGNANCLTCTGDACWISFLEFCRRNNLFTNPTLWPDYGSKTQRQPIIGRLERALNYAAIVREAHSQVTFGKKKMLDHIHSIDKPEKMKTVNHEREESTNTPSSELRRFRINLKGTMIDLDDEMWRLRELKLMEDSELIDADQDDNLNFDDTEFTVTGYEHEEEQEHPSRSTRNSEETVPNAVDHKINDHSQFDASPYTSEAAFDVASPLQTNESKTRALQNTSKSHTPTNPDFMVQPKYNKRSRKTRGASSVATEAYDRNPAEEFEKAGCETQ